jgi:hypothetical protein
MVQVGPGGDVADALILDNLVEPPGRAAAAPTQARRRSGKGAAGSPTDPDTPAT